MSTNESAKRVIRVKRKATEEKSISNKKCKFIGSVETNTEEDIFQLLVSSQTLSQKEIQDQDSSQIKITDYEEFIKSGEQESDPKSSQTKQTITCNGEPLESIENKLSESLDFVYDIYIYDNEDYFEFRENDPKECDDEEEDSNDENYVYNDYPDENEVSNEVTDYYDYRDYDDDSQREFRSHFSRTRISSDYDLNDESYDRIVVKDSDSDTSSSDDSRPEFDE